jgi:AcrR family transcriptional regulator
VSEGLLFQRYRSKADLFFAALAPPSADPAAALAGGRVDADGAGESLERAALRMLAYFREVMPLLLRLVNHPDFDPERFFRREAPALLQGWIEALVEFLDAQREDRRPSPSTSRDAASLMTAALFGVAFIDTAGIHGAPLGDDAVRRMVKALRDGIGS